jgi:hypothetical protein
VERFSHLLGLAGFSRYIQRMFKRSFLLVAAALVMTPAPAFAGASGFTVINATGAGLSSLAIRRTGTDNWQPLPAAPAAGAASSVAFTDPDCAFDLRATVAGNGTAVWSGINLCGTTRLTLRRRPSGETWVDYD